jgi:hypothetical protein
MNQPHVLCDCEAIVHLRFRHLGQFFIEQGDYYDAPQKQGPVVHPKCTTDKGLIQGGSTIDQ